MFTHRIDDDLELRLPEEADAEEFYALIDANMKYLLPWLPTMDRNKSSDDTLKFIQRQRVRYAEGTHVMGFIWFKSKLVGTLSLMGINPHDSAEVGFWVSESHQGKGIVSRCCAALLQHAFESMSLNRLQMGCMTNNAKSLKIIERLGFKLIGIHRESEKHSAGYQDIVEYDLLAREWREMQTTS